MRLAGLLAVVLLSLASPVWADPADGETELGELEQALATDQAQTESSDCAVACKALESMIRSAERICELDQGERCVEARRKVAEARRRVHDACPECAAAAEDKAQAKPAPEAAKPTTPDEATLKNGGEEAPAPPSESKRGCAACTVGRRVDDSGAIWMMLGLAAVVAGRRERK